MAVIPLSLKKMLCFRRHFPNFDGSVDCFCFFTIFQHYLDCLNIKFQKWEAVCLLVQTILPEFAKKKGQKNQEKLLSQRSQNTVGRVTVNTALHSLALVIIFMHFQIGASILPSAFCSEIQWSPNSYSEKMQVYEVSIFIDILFLEIELIYWYCQTFAQHY